MEPYRVYYFGLQILLLAYTAQSFVLLTANMEDIRKLARKFVSDSLADKIAEFIVKATEQVTTQMTNMSDEDMIQDISGDNNNYKLNNIARNREEKQRLTKKEMQYSKKDYMKIKSKDKSVEIAPHDWRKESNELSKNDKKKQNLLRDSNEVLNEKINKIAEAKKNWQKEKNEISNDKLDRIIQSKINDWQKDKYEMTNERFEEEFQQNDKLNKPDDKKQYYINLGKSTYGSKDLTKMEFQESKPFKPTSKTRFVTTYRPPKADTKRPDENSSAEERPSSKKHKNRDKISEASYEDNDKKFEYETTSRFDFESTVYNGLRAGAVGMTTEKEKTDFDQYDNRNYPKATKEQFVATSGTMMLPKLERQEEKNWWEKEMKTNVKEDMVHFRAV